MIKFIKKNRQHYNNHGSVLLFALLMMSSVIIGSIGLGTLIMDLLQQTKLTDSSIMAYYAAETGIEQSLYNARKTGELPPSYDEDNPVALTNGTAWWGQVTGTTEIIYADIPEDRFVEVNLFNPDAPNIATNIASVEVTWEDSCAGCTVLMANMVSWSPGGSIDWEPNAYTTGFPGGFATLSTGSPNKLHKLRLLAKNSKLENVRVRAYDSSGNPELLPGRVEIDVYEKFTNARRRLVASMPRGAPLSGIFDYVIFSDCSLVKGGRSISCP